MIFAFISCVDSPPLDLNNPSDVESAHYQPKIPLGFSGEMTSDHHAAMTWYSLKAAPCGFILQRRSEHQTAFTDLVTAPKERFQTLYDAGDYRMNIFIDSLMILKDSAYVYRIAAYRNSFVSGFSEEVSIIGTRSFTAGVVKRIK